MLAKAPARVASTAPRCRRPSRTTSRSSPRDPQPALDVERVEGPSAARHVEGRVQPAAQARLGQGRHVQRLAEARRIDTADRAPGAESRRRPMERAADAGAGGNPRALDGRRVEHQRAARAARVQADLVAGGRIRRQRRHPEAARQPAQVEAGDPPFELAGDLAAGPRRHDDAGGGRSRAVGPGRRLELDAAVGDRRACLERLRAIAGHIRRLGAQIGAAIDVVGGVDGQVHPGGGGDAAGRQIAGEAAQVQLADAGLAAQPPVGALGIGDEPGADGARLAPQREVGRQIVERAARRELDRRLHLHVGEGRREAGELARRQLVGGEREIDHRLLQVGPDVAARRQAALGGPDGQPLEMDVVVVHPHDAGEAVERQRRLCSAERQVAHLHPEVDRLIGERGLEVDALEPPRQAGRFLARRLLHRDRAVRDADAPERDRPRGALAVRFLRLFLHQRRQVPAVRPPAQRDARLVDPDLVDHHLAADEVPQAVTQPDVPGGEDRVPPLGHRQPLDLDPGEQVAVQALDDEVSVQVVVGLAHDVAPQPVLEPGGLGRDQRDDDEADEEGQHERADAQPAPDSCHGRDLRIALRRPGRCSRVRATAAARARRARAARGSD
jgi:hypothetical protein